MENDGRGFGIAALIFGVLAAVLLFVTGYASLVIAGIGLHCAKKAKNLGCTNACQTVGYILSDLVMWASIAWVIWVLVFGAATAHFVLSFADAMGEILEAF